MSFQTAQEGSERAGPLDPSLEGPPAGATRRRLRLPRAGIELSLLDWGGEGTPALLHHANGFCAALWAPVAEALRDEFRVIAVDARGHGHSDAPEGDAAYEWNLLASDVEELADLLLAETGHDRFALALGHSFGATLLLTVAARRPGLFARVCALDPVLLPPPGAAAPPRGMSLAAGARKRRALWPDRDEARAWFAERPFFASWTARALDLYVDEGLGETPDGQLTLRCPPRVEAAIFSGGLDPWQELPGVRAPVRIVWASQRSFPRALPERLVAMIRERGGEASLEALDCGHLIPMEQPERVVASVQRLCADRA